MRKQRMLIELEGRDDEVEVLVDGRAIRLWEAQNKASFIETPLSYTTLCELGVHAGMRSGQLDGDFDDIMDTVVNVVQVGDDVDPNPTSKGAGDDSSQLSPSAPASRSGSGKKTRKQP